MITVIKQGSAAVDLESLDVRELIHTVWELRQASLQLDDSSGSKFLCTNCEQMKPFAGENALEYYTAAGGVALVCNECLLDFNRRRGVNRVKPM
jgi:hypothetical protein